MKTVLTIALTLLAASLTVAPWRVTAQSAPLTEHPLDQLSGDDFDRAFLALMTMHHGMAVAMARPVVSGARHAELSQLAQSIITAQTGEIAQMRAWAREWYGLQLPDPLAMMGMMETTSPPVQLPMGGHGGMDGAGPHSMAGDQIGEMSMVADLGKLPAPRLEAVFMSLMIPHHEGAVSMARAALDRAAHQELRDLAQQIIASQTAEIEQLNAWLADWYGL